MKWRTSNHKKKKEKKNMKRASVLPLKKVPLI